MEAKDFESALRRMVESLEAHPAITVDTQRIGGPLEGSVGVEVPESVRAYYEAVDGFEVTWRLDAKVGQPLVEAAGTAAVSPVSIKFPSLAEILDSPGVAGAEDEQARDNLVVVHPSGYEIHVGLLLDNGVLGHKLHSFSHFDDSFLDLGGTIGDYFEACVQARGIGSWSNCWGSFDRGEYDNFDFATIVRALFGEDSPLSAYQVPVWDDDDDDDDDDEDEDA